MAKRGRSSDAAPPAKRAKEAPQKPGIGMAWGQNSLGQVGVGLDKAERKKPALFELPEGSAVRCMAAGGMHTVAVTMDGKVYTFGCNDEWALGRTCVETDDLPKDEAEALPGLAEGLDGVNVVGVSAGDSHTFVLADDGSVYGCGCFRDPSGAFGFSDSSFLAKEFTKVYPSPDATGLPPAKQIASGADHVVILTEDASGKTAVYTYGSADQGQLGRLPFNKCDREAEFRGKHVPRSDEFNKKAADRRTNVSCLWTMLNFQPVINCPWKKKKLVSLFAGGWSTGVVDASGTVYAWGLNNYGQLGIKSGASAGPATIEYHPKKCQYFVGCPMQKVACGQHHSVCLSTAGEVHTIGRGDTGQLGKVENGAVMSESSTLQKLDTLQNVVDVACGGSCSFAITDAGKAYSWGFGENLQLGGDDEEDRPEPTLVSSKQFDPREVVQIDAGGQHSCGFARDC